ncbi:hypothetical protein GCM10008171_22100 [Methylopila jiangsuensis]|uniref:Uncharacterized protein n=1 Tax=Methylopila jiangsuensis TaxID=586230 RepID=A0A9W6JIC8_9HYPH|nr:hypothetical protein [Methylopila jiangsuensis]GLK76956.1 hypothetical protein GCM10008171_22100 [Methylopila jiangsuensis]
MSSLSLASPRKAGGTRERRAGARAGFRRIAVPAAVSHGKVTQ